GIELAAFAGKVSATVDTRIALPELTFGLIPGAGGTVSIPARIGRRRTAWLALTGTPLDPQTALDWGLVAHLLSPASPLHSLDAGECRVQRVFKRFERRDLRSRDCTGEIVPSRGDRGRPRRSPHPSRAASAGRRPRRSPQGS